MTVSESSLSMLERCSVDLKLPSVIHSAPAADWKTLGGSHSRWRGSFGATG